MQGERGLDTIRGRGDDEVRVAGNVPGRIDTGGGGLLALVDDETSVLDGAASEA